MPQSGTSRLQVPFNDLAAEYQNLETEITDSIRRVLSKGDFILGRDVDLFEEEFASFCSTRYAVGVDSGLSALELILRAYRVGPGQEVIIPANTFIASALAISATGATPVLVDVDPQTFTMDTGAARRAITPRSAAIMPVHLYGHPAEMETICEIARERGIPVIEDACQAHGALYQGRRVGSLGHAAAFSFYPAKNLGCYGDGGMVLTNDPEIAKYVRMARNYGQRQKYFHAIRGYNRRLDTIQAAILRIKLRHLDEQNAARRKSARLYQKLLSDAELALPRAASYVQPVWHLFVIRSQCRDGLQKHLASQRIATGVHYPIPVHLQEAYTDLGYTKGAFPVAERCAEEILSLPMYPELTHEMIEHVAATITGFRPELAF